MAIHITSILLPVPLVSNFRTTCWQICDGHLKSAWYAVLSLGLSRRAGGRDVFFHISFSQHLKPAFNKISLNLGKNHCNEFFRIQAYPLQAVLNGYRTFSETLFEKDTVKWDCMLYI